MGRLSNTDSHFCTHILWPHFHRDLPLEPQADETPWATRTQGKKGEYLYVYLIDKFPLTSQGCCKERRSSTEVLSSVTAPAKHSSYVSCCDVNEHCPPPPHGRATSASSFTFTWFLDSALFLRHLPSPSITYGQVVTLKSLRSKTYSPPLPSCLSEGYPQETPLPSGGEPASYKSFLFANASYTITLLFHSLL